MSPSAAASAAVTVTSDRIAQLNARAMELIRTDPEQARLAAQQALELCVAGDVASGPAIATSTFLLGQCALLAGRYDEASEHAARSLEASRLSADVAQAHNLIGAIDFRRCRYASAIEHFQQTATIQRELGDLEREGGALGNLGLVYHALGDYARALENLEAAMRRFRDAGDRQGEAFTLGNIGVVYNDVADYAKAREHHERALSILEALDDRVGQAVSHNGIGIAAHRLGEHAVALEHFNRSLELARGLGDAKSEVEALDNIASALVALDRHDEACPVAERALELANTLGDARAAISPRLALGRAAMLRGENENAREHFDAALEAAIDTGSRAYRVTIHRELARACRALGDLEAALGHLEKSIVAREELFSSESDERVRRMQARYDVVSARAEAEIERLRNVELAQALDDLKHAESQLVHSEKMASLGQLTAGIAHEINNPVNFIRASTAPLVRDVGLLADAIRRVRAWRENGADASSLADLFDENELDETIEEIGALLRAIEDGADRTAEIVRGLRNFSHIDENDVKRASLHDGLDATLVLLSSRLRDGITVERAYADIPDVECYPGQINQVFMNILSNAIDAIDGRGSITITTSSDADTVSVAIRDSGCGIPESVARRIFEPFFTTKEVGKGTGLGLAISYRIVEAHGGRIDLDSTPGEGTEFRVALPVRRVVGEG
jgi:two-component system, NtrC family, sensor kinase